MVDYYDQIAKGYNELHKEEQLQKLKVIKKYLKPKPTQKLLDIGCGTGISTNWKCRCTGIDPSKELIAIAKKDYSKHKFIQAKAESLPFKDNTFDIIISITAAQNFTNLKKAIKEIKRVAKPKAEIIITILKKSKKTKQLKTLLKTYKIIEQEKDFIFIS